MKRISRPSKLSRGKLAALGIVAVVSLGVFLSLRSLSGPAVGDIYRPSQGTNIEKPTYVEVDGKNIVFNYPEDYVPDPPGKSQPNVLEYYTFKKSGGDRGGNLILAVSVYRLQSDKLEEDGAFRIRNERPDEYQLRLSSINDYPFYIFKKKDGSETTAFTRNGDMVAAVSVSGTLANSSQSETELTALLNSLRWKN